MTTALDHQQPMPNGRQRADPADLPAMRKLPPQAAGRLMNNAAMAVSCLITQTSPAATDKHPEYAAFGILAARFYRACHSLRAVWL
jgi:hypothetical protein